MIDRNSRYRQTPTLTVTDPAGDEIQLLDLRPIPSTGGVFSTTPTDSDRLDRYAWKYYRDPLKFWRICDAADALDPFDVVAVGEPLLIPPDK